MRFSTVILSFFVVVAGVGVARADIPPADSCTAPGQPCQNAGAVTNAPGQPGTCVATTCTKQVRGADGGLTPISYDCNRCEANGGNGGNGGGSATGGNGGSSATGTGGETATGGSSAPPGTGGSTVHTGGGSSGCSVVPGGSSDDASGALAVLLVLALAVALRRRHAST
jgi:MYXO-CTERM domain-containing protein